MGVKEKLKALEHYVVMMQRKYYSLQQISTDSTEVKYIS